MDRFASGDSEVDSWFRERRWWGENERASPPTYSFLTPQEELLGYASAAKSKKGLVLYVIGLHADFHGVKNPAAPHETYAVSVWKEVEALGRSKGCGALCLRVRASNERAIGFYEKVGMRVDGAPFSEDEGAPLLEMTKPL